MFPVQLDIDISLELADHIVKYTTVDSTGMPVVSGENAVVAGFVREFKLVNGRAAVVAAPETVTAAANMNMIGLGTKHDRRNKGKHEEMVLDGSTLTRYYGDNDVDDDALAKIRQKNEKKEEDEDDDEAEAIFLRNNEKIKKWRLECGDD